MSNKIHYVRGSAIYPRGDGVKFIVNLCNNSGNWYNDFVEALGRKWYSVRTFYTLWHAGQYWETPFELGALQLVNVEDDIYVVNVIAEDRKSSRSDYPTISLHSLELSLIKLADTALAYQASVHMPRIDMSTSAGNWYQIEFIINTTLIQLGISVTVYE